jgi:hypothetical protein
VNPSLLCVLAVLAADPVPSFQEPIYRTNLQLRESLYESHSPAVTVRGQDSPYYGGEGTPPTYTPPGGSIPAPAYPGSVDPFGGSVTQPYGSPYTGDPFAGGIVTPAPYGYDPFSPQQSGSYTFGLNGPQPFQYGWQGRYDFGWLAEADTSNPDVGSLTVFEVDIEKELNAPLGGGYTFSFAPQAGYRGWEGPLGTPASNAGLPPAAYRLGLGLKLATPVYGAWQFEAGFNPSLGTDFNESPSSDAMMWDGHLVAFYRTSPQWMFAAGAAYWDRVDEIILPYAGVVWTPSDYWEFRLLFPKPRISYFTGAPLGVPTWLYVAGEYKVEAFEVNVDPINRATQVQFEDWRVLGGVRSEFGSLTAFLEAGWIFNRDVEFKDVFSSDFEIDDGFIARAGFRY